MAQLTWAQTGSYDERTLLRMLVAGVGPDGSTAGAAVDGSSSSATEGDDASGLLPGTTLLFRDRATTPPLLAVPSSTNPWPISGPVVNGVALTPITASFSAESGNKIVGAVPASGKRFLVHRIEYAVISGSATTVGHRDGAGGTIVGKRRLPATEGYVAVVDLGDNYHQLTVDTALYINASASWTGEVTAWVESV